MTLLQVLSSVAAIEAPVFHTSDAAVTLGVSQAHASTMLARLAASGQVMRLRRGVWALRDRVDPLALPEHLTFPFPAYVSLQSALYLHGMISQVPAIIYAVSLARTRRFTTPLGTVSVHHVAPRFFFGFEDVGRRGGRMATPEKALVDFLYLGPARSNLFRALPELTWPSAFRAGVARRIVRRVEPARRRTLVSRALERLLETRSRTAIRNVAADAIIGPVPGPHYRPVGAASRSHSVIGPRCPPGTASASWRCCSESVASGTELSRKASIHGIGQEVSSTDREAGAGGPGRHPDGCAPGRGDGGASAVVVVCVPPQVAGRDDGAGEHGDTCVA